MFDKNVKNTYTNKLWAFGFTAALVFSYAPLVIADPLINTRTDTLTVVQKDLSSAEDEDPASANRSFKPTTLTETIILNHANNLGLNAFVLKEQLYAFADMTKQIESDNKRSATNPYSGAMSYYQFLPDSVVTAVNRLEILMKQQGMGRVPAWASTVHKNPQEIYNLSMPQQRLLVIANIIEQDRSDAYILELGSGNNLIAKNLYYKFHHTAPDTATRNRTNSLYPQYFSKTI